MAIPPVSGRRVRSGGPAARPRQAEEKRSRSKEGASAIVGYGVAPPVVQAQVGCPNPQGCRLGTDFPAEQDVEQMRAEGADQRGGKRIAVARLIALFSNLATRRIRDGEPLAADSGANMPGAGSTSRSELHVASHLAHGIIRYIAAAMRRNVVDCMRRIIQVSATRLERNPIVGNECIWKST